MRGFNSLSNRVRPCIGALMRDVHKCAVAFRLTLKGLL